MPYIITHTSSKGRQSYWQTPWFSKERIVDADGNATYDRNGEPLFKRARDGSVQYREIGGWCGKAEYATVYDDYNEAVMVNVMRGLNADVTEA